GHFRALFYCGIGQVMEVVGKGSPGVMPSSITLISVATGTRLGVDVPWPWWGRRFAVRLSADVLGTLHDAAFHVVGRSQPTWTTTGLTVGLNAGLAADLHLK